jgi:hypothetical protein
VADEQTVTLHGCRNVWGDNWDHFSTSSVSERASATSSSRINSERLLDIWLNLAPRLRCPRRIVRPRRRRRSRPPCSAAMRPAKRSSSQRRWVEIARQLGEGVGRCRSEPIRSSCCVNASMREPHGKVAAPDSWPVSLGDRDRSRSRSEPTGVAMASSAPAHLSAQRAHQQLELA